MVKDTVAAAMSTQELSVPAALGTRQRWAAADSQAA